MPQLPACAFTAEMLRAGDIAQFERELAAIDGHLARQEWLLRAINRATGADFSAINLTDELGRVLGGMAYPITPELGQKLAKYTPTLNAIMVVSQIHSEFWSWGPNKAFLCPKPMLHSSQEYQSVYRHFGMHHMAFFLYPPANEYRIVLGISSAKHAFTKGDLRSLEKLCQHFSRDIIDVAPSGVTYPKFSVLADQTTTLDAKLQPRSISEYMHSLLAFFYGGLPVTAEGLRLLPVELTRAIDRSIQLRTRSVMPLENGVCFCLSKRRQGRSLCSVIQVQGEQHQFSCYEDFSQLDHLHRVRAVCNTLKRDQYAVLSACLAMMDGAKGHAEILKRACLSALKPASGRRIVSCAKRVLETA